jgi:outer membrane protein TolC
MSKRIIVPVLLLGLVLVGGALALATPNEQRSAAAEPGRQPATKDAKVKELLKERLATLHELVKAATADYHAGRIGFDRVHQATRALLDAELEQCESDKERIKVLEEIVALSKESERNAVQRYKTGAATQSDALMATAGRLDAEIALERAKSKATAQPK